MKIKNLQASLFACTDLVTESRFLFMNGIDEMGDGPENQIIKTREEICVLTEGVQEAQEKINQLDPEIKEVADKY
jgi:hypothetical protein